MSIMGDNDDEIVRLCQLEISENDLVSSKENDFIVKVLNLSFLLFLGLNIVK